MVKIFTRHAHSSSINLRDVGGIEPSIHSRPAVHSLKGTAADCLSPGDSVRRDSAPDTRSVLAEALPLQTKSIWTDIPASLISPNVRRMRSGSGYAEEASNTSRLRNSAQNLVSR